MRQTRRQFLQTSTFMTAALPLFGAASGDKLPIGFSTLGCPAWEWGKILDFAPDRIEQSKKEVAAHGLKISCVSSSSEMHHKDPAKRAQQLADAKKFIDLASTLGVPNVRVFGNKIEGPQDEVVAWVADGLRQLGDYAGPKNVTVIIESHGDFTTSPILKAVLEKANHPHVALLWDANHTFVDGKEDPAVTIEQLGKYVRHTHLKDSVM